MKTWAEKYKDPRWQKKRLEILERANFICEECGYDKNTLHVHHGYYEKGFEPWDYPNETLWCLCDNCHEDVEITKSDLYREMAKIFPAMLYKLMSAITKLRDNPFKDV